MVFCTCILELNKKKDSTLAYLACLGNSERSEAGSNGGPKARSCDLGAKRLGIGTAKVKKKNLRTTTTTTTTTTDGRSKMTQTHMRIPPNFCFFVFLFLRLFQIFYTKIFLQTFFNVFTLKLFLNFFFNIFTLKW